jgi:hypothetical protein
LTGTGTWAIKRDLTLINNANQYGYSESNRVNLPDGTYNKRLISFNLGTQDFELEVYKKVTTGLVLVSFDENEEKNTTSLTDKKFYLHSNGIMYFPVFMGGGSISNNQYTNAPITLKKVGNLYTFYQNNAALASGTTTVTSTFINIGGYQEGVIASIRIKLNGVWQSILWNDSATLLDMEYTNLVIPRDESDITKDIFGKDLQFVGRVASDMKFVQSNKGEVAVTTDYGQFNFDCTGVTIVSKEGETTVNINQSNNRLIFTGIGNGSIYHIVLSNGLTFPIAEGSGVVSYAENDSTKTLTWFGNFDWSTQDTYHHNITQGFSLVGSVKVPYKINGAYSNAATNGHNQAETKFKQVTFREDFGASSLHFDQSDLSSKVITYADIANTANVFVNQFPNVKINLETFSPVGIINQSNRQNNGLRRNKDTFFGNNK